MARHNDANRLLEIAEKLEEIARGYLEKAATLHHEAARNRALASVLARRDDTHPADPGIIDGRKEERERCIAIVMERAAKWADHARQANHGDCSDSLAEECEDIAVAIRGLDNDRHR